MLGTKRKDDFEPYWQDEKDWLCIVEFLPTDSLGFLAPTSSGTWSVMQISRTQARLDSSAIPMLALTTFYFPFRLLRRKTSS